MKKILRIITKFLSYIFIKIINRILKKTNYKILPALDNLKQFDFIYNVKTRRLVLENNKNEFEKIYIDTSFYNSELCNLGKKYSSNKSPMNLEGHRSGFSGLYSILFFQQKNKTIKLAEIGIEKNSSTQMWRKYFKNAEIHGFEFDQQKIKKAKKQKLKKTFYHRIDVTNPKIINESFKKTKIKYDIIIDDSTHIFEHQINVVNECFKYLRKDGILIIEDIYKNNKLYSEQNYYNILKKIKRYFREIIFIETLNMNNYTAGWKNEKILFFVKK
jgi:SAM-dependent methyltransferase